MERETPRRGEETFHVVEDGDKSVTRLDGEEKVRQDTVFHACPNCGAPMRYDPDGVALSCAFCGTEVPIETLDASERLLEFRLDTAPRWREETHVFSCDNCGAQTVLDKGVFAAECAFCGSPNVVCRDDVEGIRPDSVLPFAFSADEAAERYRDWIGRRLYAPRDFRRGKRGDVRFRGVYSPAWTFDSHTRSTYTGRVGDYYTVTVGSGKNAHTETRIRWRDVAGTFERRFDDVMIESGARLDDRILAKIGPFPTTGAVRYDAGFLAGFTAEHYALGIEEGWTAAARIMRTRIEQEVRASLRCDVVDYLNIVPTFFDNTFKYVLLPVYVMRKTYRKKTYTAYVNGATGKVSGTYPISAGRVLLTVGLSLVAVGLIAFLIWLGLR